MAKYDPKIVMEFYANAWPTEEGVRDKRSIRLNLVCSSDGFLETKC